MKRIKSKKVWVKRIHLEAQTYDFISTDLKDANHIIEHTANLTIGTKFVMPTKIEVLKIEIEQFLKQKKYEMVFAVFIVILTIVIERVFTNLF